MSIKNGINIVSGDESAGVENRDIKAWQYAWARLISKMWANDALKTKLINDSQGDLVTEELRKLGYTPPKGLKIIVEEVDKKVVGTWENTESKGNPDDKEGFVARSNGYESMLSELSGRVIMILPPKPNNDEDNALALADYSATGKDYPFSL